MGDAASFSFDEGAAPATPAASAASGASGAEPGGAAPDQPQTFSFEEAAVPAPTAAPAPMTGVAANIGAGMNDALAGTLGPPVDLTTGALNLASRGIKAATGYDLGQISNPVGGSGSIKSALGVVGADPRLVAPADGTEQLARAAGSGAASMVLPWGVARALPVMTGMAGAAQDAFGAGSAGTMAGAGAIGGVAGQVAENAAPDALKPLANTVGNMLGGGLALGSVAATKALIDAGTATAQTVLAPLTAAGQEGLAAKRIAGAATDLPAVQATLDTQPAPLVPGSNPTTYQLTGDAGLGNLERATAKNTPAPFIDRAADQNAARVAALQGTAPADASPEAVGQLFRQHLSDLDAARDSQVAALTGDTQGAIAGAGAPTTPQQAGETIRQGVAANYAPAFQAADIAVQGAQARASGAVDALGGSLPATADQQATALQGFGQRIRSGLDDLNQQAKAHESALWNAVDPDGSLTVPMTPIKQAANRIVGQMPANAAPLAGDEAAIFQTARSLPAVQPFDELVALRSRLTDAMRTERLANGQSQSLRRMSQLMDGVSDAMQGAVQDRAAQESAAVASGQMSPEAIMDARVQQEVADWRQRRAAAANADGASVDSIGVGNTPGAGAPGMSGLDRGQGQIPSGSGNVGRDPGLAPAPANVAPAATFDADAANRYATARQATAQRHATFSDAPGVGQVLKQGARAGDYRLGDSQVPAAIFNSGKGAAERMRAFVAAGGSRPDLVSDLKNYAAFDLRRAAQDPDGTLNMQRYQRWASAHAEALSAFPELRGQFDHAASARRTLDDLKQQRAALDDAYPIKPGWGDAEIAGRFFRPGPRGAQDAQSLVRAAGGQTKAVAALKDYAAWSLRQAAEKDDGTLDLGKYDRWMKAHDQALSAFPDLKAKFAKAADAQTALEQSAAAHMAVRKAFETSAARHFLDDADPVAKVGRILGSDTAQSQMAQLARLTARDAPARAGLQRAVVEYALRELRGNAEAGSSGLTAIKSDAFQTFIRKRAPALSEIFSRRQMEALRDVAADLQRSNRSIAGTKLPGGSNTAQDLAAGETHGHGNPSMLVPLLIAEAAGEAAGHVAGPFAKLVGAIGVPLLNSARRRGLAHVDDLVTEAMLHPALARSLLTKVAPSGRSPVLPTAMKQIRALGMSAGSRSGNDEPAPVPMGYRGLATSNAFPRVSEFAH